MSQAPPKPKAAPKRSSSGFSPESDIGVTPLWIAIAHGYETVVPALLSAGADCNKADTFVDGGCDRSRHRGVRAVCSWRGQESGGQVLPPDRATSGRRLLMIFVGILTEIDEHCEEHAKQRCSNEHIEMREKIYW